MQILGNHRQLDKILKVDHIDVGCTFVHKNERANQEQLRTIKPVIIDSWSWLQSFTSSRRGLGRMKEPNSSRVIFSHCTCVIIR